MSRAGDVLENPILFTREFEDVLYFTRPPRIVQKVLFGGLAPLARLLGYKGSYPEYPKRGPSGRVEGEPWPTPEWDSDLPASA